jgi:UDP-N-acetylglucosamine 1-carboxyvinyltransferase
MSKIRIKGGKKLEGIVKISGAKNAILPIIAATLLTKDEIILENVPNLSDVHIMLELLKEIGSESKFDIQNNRLTIFAKDDIDFEIKNAELSEKIRTSSLFLGPILVVKGRVKIPRPGGCNLGARLIDMHLHFLKEMGAEVSEDEASVSLNTEKKIHGVEANFYKMSVGATQNIMMAAALAEGKTIINGASLEPETIDLGNFLISMGAKIKGLGISRIEIEGVNELKQQTPYKIIHDRLEAGTYAIAALATKGELILENTPHQYLKYFLNILKQIGAKIKIDGENLIVQYDKKIQAKSIATAPHPYFPTDLQQIYAALMTTADGISAIEENIFDGRFVFAKELEKMGARIFYKDKNKILIEGIERLQSFDDLYGMDLRGSMALFIAALKAQGESILKNVFYIERGYEDFCQKFLNIGADLEI